MQEAFFANITNMIKTTSVIKAWGAPGSRMGRNRQNGSDPRKLSPSGQCQGFTKVFWGLVLDFKEPCWSQKDHRHLSLWKVVYWLLDSAPPHAGLRARCLGPVFGLFL